MNEKYSLIIFSLLLCTTFGHEYHRARSLHTSPRNQKTANTKTYFVERQHHGTSDRKFKDIGLAKCTYTCPVLPKLTGLNKVALKLDKFVELEAFGLFDPLGTIGVMFDINSVVVLNGKTGATVLIDITTDTGIYFKPGANDQLWDESKILPSVYLLNLGSLSVIKTWANGQKFNVKSTPKIVIDEMVSVITQLDVSFKEIAKKNPHGVLTGIVAITKSFTKYDKIVRLLLSKLDSHVIVTTFDIISLHSTFKGLSELDKMLPGGLEILITEKFELPLLLISFSGLEEILGFFRIADTKIDFATLGDLVKNPETLLGLAVTCDGGLYNGIRGIVAVIYNIQLYVCKKINLEALIDIFIQVAAANNSEKIDEEQWNDGINFMLKTLKHQKETFENGEELSDVTKFFKDLKAEKLFIGGINVSAIIKLLIKSSGKSADLSLVVKLLTSLKTVVSVQTGISTLFLRLVWFVVSGQGVVYVTSLIPNLQVSLDFSSSKSIIKQILGQIEVGKIWKYIITLNVVGVITNLPVIGPIYTNLQDALSKTEDSVKFGLESILKENHSILTVIKNWLWFGLGVNGGKEPSGGGIAGLKIIGAGSSVSLNAEWTSTVEFSQNGSGQINSEIVVTESSKITGWNVIKGTISYSGGGYGKVFSGNQIKNEVINYGGGK